MAVPDAEPGERIALGTQLFRFVVTGVLLTAGGYAYRWYAARRAARRADALDLPEGVAA